MRYKLVLCERPGCGKRFRPRVHNQRVCKDEVCIAWKARENVQAFRERRRQQAKAEEPQEPVTPPSWGDGCCVGSILFCPFPGVTSW